MKLFSQNKLPLESVPSYRKIWNLSYPIILSLLAQNLIAVIDTAFLGRVGEIELGASAIGGLFYYWIFMLGFGFGNGAQILMARRNGEGNYKQVGRIFYHTMYIFVAMGVLLIVLIWFFAPSFLSAFITSPDIYKASIEYLDYRIWGIMFAFTNVAFRAFLVGTTRTGLLGISAAIMAIVNISLDYVLIFGHFGFPEMGISGAALASVISEGVAALFFIVATLSSKASRKYHIFRLPKFDGGIIRRTWNLSVFIMLQNFVSIAAWFLFFMLIEHLGERPLAVSNIIRSLYTLLMIHIWAFSTLVNTLVSNAIGEGHKNAVIPIIHKVNRMGMAISFVVLAVALLIPELLIRIYTDDPLLIADARPVLLVVLGAIVPMSVSINWFSGVSGTANTRSALAIETATIGLYVLYIIVLTYVFHASLPLIWTSEYLYYAVIGISSWLYLKYGNWQKKVI
ncbi:MAG TPA: MATE family efflux transporter [Bacteroidales bacterium]|nr:MATE family efflux transporter [Bacteroidales bacterium]